MFILRQAFAKERRLNTTDYDMYEGLCAEFQRQWVGLLIDTLKKHGLPVDSAKEICGEFSFNLSMLFDQGEIDISGTTYRPVVAFTDDEEEPAILIRTDGPEFHEHAFGTTAEAYEA